MSATEHDKARDAIIQFQKLFADLQKQQLQRQEAERKRRAALTPQQRAAEDRAAAARAAQIEQQKLTQKLAKMGDVLRKSDTWTIADFCWLLLAESPADSDSWSLFDGRSGKATKLHREYSAILGSCLQTRLKPVNPADPPEKHRFTVQSLVQVARQKRLGCVDVLAEVIGLKPQPIATTIPPLPAKKPAPAAQTLAATGTESRERQRMRRRLQLLETARILAKEGEGSVHATHIALSMNGKQFAERFKKKFPEWQHVSERTLEGDRTACKPRIAVTTGRPRKAQTE